MKTSLGIWALGPMVTRFVPVGYQPEHADEPTAGEGAPRRGRPRRPDGRLRVPLPAGALARQPRRGARGARRPRHLLPSRQRPAPRPALRPRRARVARRRPRATRRAGSRARRADFAGSLGAHFIIWPGIEGYNYPFQTPYADSWRWLIEGIGEAAEVCDGHGVKLFLEHKNSEPAMKILMRNIGMTLHVIHKLRAEGDRQRAGQHGLAAPDHERRAPARVRGAARRRGAARPPARQLRLGHLRRRQHGRRDRVHGDARARARAAPRRLRRTAASGSGFDLYPYTEDQVAAVRRSVEQWRFIDGVAARIDDAGAARGPAARRTRCAPTSSCTPRSARDAPSGSTSARRASRALALAEDGSVLARAERGLRLRHAAAGLGRAGPRGCGGTRGAGGAGRAARGRRARRASGCPARCTGWSRSTRPTGCCGRRSSGTTSARRRECAEIEERVGLDGADRADRQPRADRLHRAEAAVDAPPRAGALRAHRLGAAAEGLRAAAAERRAARPTWPTRAGTLLFDVAARGAGRDEVLDALELDAAWLPRALESPEVVGRRRRRRAGGGRRRRPGRGRARRGGRPARARRRSCSARRAWCSRRSRRSRPTRRRACTPSATPCPAPGTRWA